MRLTAESKLGPYVIVSAIGAGGMGEVYRARDPRLGRDVAIKVLPSSFSADPDLLRRFELEARAAAALNHPNILAVHDVGTHDGVPYLVSELLEGETLRERLSQSPRASVVGPPDPARSAVAVSSASHAGLSVRRAVEYAIHIAHGLAAAHDKNLVHRDLEPENVFITTDGRLKILDFGLAKLTESVGASNATALPPTTPNLNTHAGMILGTMGYMAPEQVRGQPVDHRADIFAFGVTLYEMLAGHRAFHGDTSADTISAILKEDPPDLPVAERHIPPALERIVDRCLEKNPSARFQSATDLAFALESLVLALGPIGGGRRARGGAGAPVSPTDRVDRRCGRRHRADRHWSRHRAPPSRDSAGSRSRPVSHHLSREHNPLAGRPDGHLARRTTRRLRRPLEGSAGAMGTSACHAGRAAASRNGGVVVPLLVAGQPIDWLLCRREAAENAAQRRSTRTPL